MKYLDIKPYDLNNGDGINVSFWVSGCPHKCKGCHNQESWNREVGQVFTMDTLAETLAHLDKPWKPDLSILGGEPLADYNYGEVKELCSFVKQAYPHRNIWLWTGYEVYELEQEGKLDILKHIDYLITGRFIEDLKDTSLSYRGSSNQSVWKVHGGELEWWM